MSESAPAPVPVVEDSKELAAEALRMMRPPSSEDATDNGPSQEQLQIRQELERVRQMTEHLQFSGLQTAVVVYYDVTQMSKDKLPPRGTASFRALNSAIYEPTFQLLVQGRTLDAIKAQVDAVLTLRYLDQVAWWTIGVILPPPASECGVVPVDTILGGLRSQQHVLIDAARYVVFYVVLPRLTADQRRLGDARVDQGWQRFRDLFDYFAPSVGQGVLPSVYQGTQEQISEAAAQMFRKIASSVPRPAARGQEAKGGGGPSQPPASLPGKGDDSAPEAPAVAAAAPSGGKKVVARKKRPEPALPDVGGK